MLEDKYIFIRMQTLWIQFYIITWSKLIYSIQLQYYYNNVNYSKMQRGKSQQSRPQQLNQRPNIDKPKPSQSKSKVLPEGNHSSYNQSNKNSINAVSPSLNKLSIESDKQNIDMFHNIIKIVSAAAEAKQKQILLSLASQMQKQKKIKQYMMSQRQSNSDKQQLQAMLVHLRQQQYKEISSLKIQIGKRKLQNLDKHDLKQDILNLNSYVMRRTKRQSLILRNEGKDLISQIYSKFDEQSKIISNLSTALEKVNSKKTMVRQKNNQILSNQQHIFSKTVDNSNREQKEKQNSLKSNTNDNSSHNDLMHKIIKLEKQNLRLMKQLSKIEEQFEIVVEEKLMLQEKLDKVEGKYREKNMRFQKLVHKFGLLVSDKKEQLQIQKMQIFQMLKSFKAFLRVHSVKIESQIINYNQKIKRNEESEQQNGLDQYSVNQSPKIKASLQSSASSFERYETILTQKQMEINNLLKIISKFKQQNEDFRLQTQITEKQNKKLLDKTQIMEKQLAQNCKNINLKIGLQQLKKQLSSEMKLFLQFNISRVLLIQERHFQINKIFQDDIKQKQSQICEQNRQIQRLKNQIAEQVRRWQCLYQQHKQQNERQKQKMIEQFTKIQNILKFQKNEAIQSLKSSIQQISISSRKQIDEKQNYIIELNKKQEQIKKILNKVQQLECQRQQIISSNYMLSKQVLQLQDKIQQLYEQISRLKNQSCQKNINHDEQLKKNQDFIANLKNQIQSSRDSLIQECGMLLENKIQQINQLKLQIERAKMISEDLNSHLLLKVDQQNKIAHQRKNKNLGILNKIELVSKQLAAIKLEHQVLKQHIECSVQIVTQQMISSVQHFYKIFKTLKADKLRVQSEVFAIDLFSNSQGDEIKQFFQWVAQVLEPSIKNVNQPLTRLQNPLKQKLKNLKNIIINLHQEAIAKADSESQPEANNKLLGIQKQQKFQLNDIEALSPEGQVEITKTEGSSFLQQFKPFKFQNILGDEDFQLRQIVDESAIVEEIEALRNELAQSLKRGQQLEKQLKLYHQKDIDNIFDF